MKIESKLLLEDLEKRTINVLDQAIQYKMLNLETLNWKENDKSWSILECIEHLNRYSDFYIPEISSRINHSKNTSSSSFKSGLLGNYFAESMLPKANFKKISTFKSMNPLGSELDLECLNKFAEEQKNLLDILEKCKSVDLNKVKTSISISKLIKLKLGDTLRVLIFHNQRHMAQAKRTLEMSKVGSTVK